MAIGIYKRRALEKIAERERIARVELKRSQKKMNCEFCGIDSVKGKTEVRTFNYKIIFVCQSCEDTVNNIDGGQRIYPLSN